MSTEESKPADLHPNGINVYGYCVTYKKDGQWIIDQCDEYLNLPAHYFFPQEALDRVAFLRERGVDCRVAALLAEPTDSPEEFERNKTNDQEDSH